MKGVILAGGRGTRLQPLTNLFPKSLLPVYDKPMIFYPLDFLIRSGVKDILIVIDYFHADMFMKYLHSGKEFGVNIQYKIQDHPHGLPDAIYHARDFVGDDDCFVVLGDNLAFDDVSTQVKSFKSGASVFTKAVNDPSRFGILYLDENDSVSDMVEKPEDPQSDLAITGLYMFDNTVFKKIPKLSKSARGEFEIVDLLELYLKEDQLSYTTLQEAWFDVGTFQGLQEAGFYISNQ